MVDQVMKVIERVIDKLLRERIDIDEMQFGFVPGRGTTDAIFLLRQLQEKYLGKRKNLYLGGICLSHPSQPSNLIHPVQKQIRFG